VNDPFLVSRLQGFADLLCDRQSFIDRNRSTSQPLLQRLAFHQLHHDARLRRRVFEPVDLGDVWVIQGSEDLGFTLKS